MPIELAFYFFTYKSGYNEIPHTITNDEYY